jgi:hypothetical protein
VRCKAQVCGCLIVGIAGSNLAQGISGICDELVTRSEESYPVCVCPTLCDLETSTLGGPSWAAAPQCMYSRTPLILINWDGQPSGYADNPNNRIFL